MPDADREEIHIADLVLDRQHREIRKGDRFVRLTRREFAILHVLASSEGYVVPREELLDRVWGPSVTVDPRTVDAHLVRVRRKLHDLDATSFRIETVWNYGYRLRAT